MTKHTYTLVQLPLFDPVVIKLTKGYEAVIDPIDADLLAFKWCVRGKDLLYAQRTCKYKRQALHRIILERILDRPLAPGEFTDHINGNPLDNRRCNLRLATFEQNAQNSRRSANNKSGYKGVSFCTRIRKWQAAIDANHRHYHLGYFDTPKEAYAAYCEAAIKYHGEYAKLD